jgi:hypothetical protein
MQTISSPEQIVDDFQSMYGGLFSNWNKEQHEEALKDFFAHYKLPSYHNEDFVQSNDTVNNQLKEELTKMQLGRD